MILTLVGGTVGLIQVAGTTESTENQHPEPKTRSAQTSAGILQYRDDEGKVLFICCFKM